MHLSGLPPYHKIVTDGDWDPDFVYENMVNDSKNIADAGYNYMRLLFGPEQDVENILTTKLQEVEQWDVATIGFGVRGSNQTDVTVMMESKCNIIYQAIRGTKCDYSYFGYVSQVGAECDICF